MLLLLLLTGWLQSFDRLSMDMERRINLAGRTIKTNATAYYDLSGDMVTVYGYPIDLLIFNNEDGEMKIYNEAKNTLIQSVNHQSGTKGTNFYYFMSGETEDMGLRRLGFDLTNTKLDENLIVTEWSPSMGMSQGFHLIELVHNEDDEPIFLGYKDKKGNYLKKTYFYDYEFITDDITFPMAITEIEFTESDSTISKTTFGNVKIGNQVDPTYFDYTIPSNVKSVR